MKQIILTIAVIFMVQFSFAQYDVSAFEAKESFTGTGNVNAIVVRIYDSNANTIQQEWKRKMRWQHLGKITETGLEVFADNVKIKEVSSNTMDIYTKPVKNAKGFIEFRVGVDLGGAFLNEKQHPDKYKAMADYLESFAREESRKGLQERIEREEAKLVELRDIKNTYKEEISDFEREIAELEKQIQQIQDKIEANNRLTAEKNKEIKEKEAELQRLRTTTIE
jgi:hypothetical protein